MQTSAPANPSPVETPPRLYLFHVKACYAGGIRVEYLRIAAHSGDAVLEAHGAHAGVKFSSVMHLARVR